MAAKFSRYIATSVQLLLATAVLTYAGDWAVLHLRMSHGGGLRTVQVDQFLATPLKGNKEEYDYMGTQPETCSVSLYPQSSYTPCWWLERHKSNWQQ